VQAASRLLEVTDEGAGLGRHGGRDRVTWPEDVRPGAREWERCRRLLTGDSYAALCMVVVKQAVDRYSAILLPRRGPPNYCRRRLRPA
jgi:hypothetical protein